VAAPPKTSRPRRESLVARALDPVVNGQSRCGPRWWPVKSPRPSGWLVRFQRGSSFGSGPAHAVGVAAGDHDVCVVEQPRRLTAVACSGRNRPHWWWPVAGDAGGAAFVGGGDEPEQQRGTGGRRAGRTPTSSTRMRSLRSRASITFPVLLSARPRGRGADHVGCGEGCALCVGSDGGDAEGDRDVALAQVVAGPLLFSVQVRGLSLMRRTGSPSSRILLISSSVTMSRSARSARSA
jgi:hypothetical protein